jgi:hypothetical protein
VHIHIIESPSADDLTCGRCEGKVLTEMLHLIGVEHQYTAVTTVAEWEDALASFVTSVKEHGRTPLLHISMHGGGDNLWLTDRSAVTPEMFRREMLQTKTALGGKLAIALSACEGFLTAAYACEGDVPFGVLLAAPWRTVEWDKAALWYCVFYYRLVKDFDWMAAGKAANAAIGDDKLFSHITERTLAEVIARRKTPR